MSVTYKIIAEANSAAVAPKIGEVLDVLNNQLQKFDDDLPKLGLRGTIKLGTLTVTREMTDNELRTARQIIEGEFHSKLPEWGLRIMDFKKQ